MFLFVHLHSFLSMEEDDAQYLIQLLEESAAKVRAWKVIPKQGSSSHPYINLTAQELQLSFLDVHSFPGEDSLPKQTILVSL